MLRRQKNKAIRTISSKVYLQKENRQCYVALHAGSRSQRVKCCVGVKCGAGTASCLQYVYGSATTVENKSTIKICLKMSADYFGLPLLQVG
jgi:hypothetical protein